jgi:TetR/AcrR family transcriptional repressor of lmrAB and yxaGH operons
MVVLVKPWEVSVPADTRERMVAAAVDALQRRGVAGMSFTDVLTSSGAARGAIYHHFPGGKAELVNEAARRNGQDVLEQMDLLPAASPRAVAEAFLSAIRPVVAASASGGGCAVAAVTVVLHEASDEWRRTASTAFDSWIGALAAKLTSAGLAPEEATDLADTLIVLLQGAHVLCRAAGNLEPFDRAARTILSLPGLARADGR